MKLINIGYENMIISNRVISIVSPGTAPIKRLIQTSKEDGMLVDATHGKKTKSVIIMDSEHIILSSLSMEIINNRFSSNNYDLNKENIYE
ncbi:MAG: DUF370 domain-containing protein [Oscillospiraceae bacterium]|nr:DUF370 domain-containing protein [Oscillospiraceae bacterium]